MQNMKLHSLACMFALTAANLAPRTFAQSVTSSQQQVVFVETTWGEHFIKSAHILHEYAWRPRFFAFSRSKPPQILSGHEELGGLWVSDVAGDHSRQVVDEPIKYYAYEGLNVYDGRQWSPDDKCLAYVGPPRSRENSGTLWVVRIKDARRWRVQVNVSSDVKWDASGERLYFWSVERNKVNHTRSWTLFVAHGPWDNPTISRVPLISLDERHDWDDSPPDGAMFSPDTRDIAYWKQGAGLVVHSLVKATGHTYNPFTFIDVSLKAVRKAQNIQWSPDKHWIYCELIVNDEGLGVWSYLVNVRAGKITPLSSLLWRLSQGRPGDTTDTNDNDISVRVNGAVWLPGKDNLLLVQVDGTPEGPMEVARGAHSDSVVWSALNPVTMRFVPVRGLPRSLGNLALRPIAISISSKGDYLRLVTQPVGTEALYERK